VGYLGGCDQEEGVIECLCQQEQAFAVDKVFKETDEFKVSLSSLY
jgi:hypothetical protein